MRRKKSWSRALALALWCSAVLGGQGTLGEEAGEDIFIEEGEEIMIGQGESLEEVLAREQAEAEEARRQAEEEAKILAEQSLLLEPASQEEIQKHLEYLTSMDSPTGSDGELILADYIAHTMESYGYTVAQQNFHEGFINENGVDAPGINVIADRGADSKERTDEIFVIATHYDSKTNPSQEDPLANDKTGAALLLEMARILSFEETDTGICFAFFSGEEDGLYGSANFSEFLETEFAERVSGLLYVEQVGYEYEGEAPYVLLTFDGQENFVGNLVRDTAESFLLIQNQEIVQKEENQKNEAVGDEQKDHALGDVQRDETSRENWSYGSDQAHSHQSFQRLGIPAVTVTQDIREPEEGLTVNLGELQYLAELFSESAAQIMRSETENSGG